MKKGKKLIIVFVLCLCCIYIVNYFVNSSKNIDILKSAKNHLNFNNSLALMFETEAGSGEYIQSNDNVWPTGDYVYNENLSKCEKESKISYNENTKKVIVEASVNDKCYVYFDIKPKVLFANYIKGLYTTNGVNNLYLHDSNLVNSAEDGSYRYAGSSEITNNFVCFGSDATKCENDNLYRIIGVFDNQVKLIKYDYANSDMLGTDGDYDETYYSKSSISSYKGYHNMINKYSYNYKNDTSINGGNGSNDWETSLLNKTNLNTNYIDYLDNISTKWANMIVDTKWNIGGYSTYEATIKAFYNSEKAKQTSKVSKIGLMYISDYGYASTPNNWNTNLSSYNTTTILDNSWIYMGVSERVINTYSTNRYVFFLEYLGNISWHNSFAGFSCRPVFYLKPSVQYVSGDGSQSNPYRIQQM